MVTVSLIFAYGHFFATHTYSNHINHWLPASNEQFCWSYLLRTGLVAKGEGLGPWEQKRHIMMTRCCCQEMQLEHVRTKCNRYRMLGSLHWQCYATIAGWYWMCVFFPTLLGQHLATTRLFFGDCSCIQCANMSTPMSSWSFNALWNPNIQGGWTGCVWQQVSFAKRGQKPLKGKNAWMTSFMKISIITVSPDLLC